MKFSYAIDPERRLIHLRYAGRFNLTRLRESVERLWADPQYHRDYSGFIDLSDGAVSVAIADLHALLDFMRDKPQVTRGRWAAVAVSPFATACGLLYQRAFSRKHTFEVFSSHEAAWQFLGLPPLPAPHLGEETSGE